MDILPIILIVLFAFFIRSTFGFGDALIAMPLLTMITGIKVAAPLMALLAFLIATIIFIRNRKQIEYRLTWRLIIAALVGVPFGVYFITSVDERLVNILLGVFIILFAFFKLRDKLTISFKSRFWPYTFGFISGLLGGAYNTNGPPVILYLSTRDLNPSVFRATLQAYFFFTGIGILISHLLAGNFTKDVLFLFLINIPIIVLVVILGERINRLFKVQQFYYIVYIILIIIGSALIINAII